MNILRALFALCVVIGGIIIFLGIFFDFESSVTTIGAGLATAGTILLSLFGSGNNDENKK